MIKNDWTIFLSFVLLTLMISCTNDMADINRLFSSNVIELERASDVEMLYSDSAKVKVRITSPVLLRHLDRREPKDEFPEGLMAEFFNERGTVSSWLTADYAIRYELQEEVITRENVILRNRKNEKLETSELIWNEKEKKIYTDKFVYITQPESGDTIQGIGFETDQDFSRFEIKNKFSGRSNIEDIRKSLGLDNSTSRSRSQTKPNQPERLSRN